MCSQQDHPPYDQPERRETPAADIVAFAGALLDEHELDRAVLRAAHEAAVQLAARFELDPS